MRSERKDAEWEIAEYVFAHLSVGEMRTETPFDLSPTIKKSYQVHKLADQDEVTHI